MPEEEGFDEIFVVGERRDIGRFGDGDWLPLKPLNEPGKVCDRDGELNGVTLADGLDRLGVDLPLLLVLVDPSLTLRSVARPVVSLAALLLIKPVLSMVDLSVSEKLVFGSNGVGDRRPLEQFEECAVGDDLALEHPVQSEAFLPTEAYRLGPREGLLEEDVFEVARHKAVLELVAVVVHTLKRVFPPASAQALCLDEDRWVELD